MLKFGLAALGLSLVIGCASSQIGQDFNVEQLVSFHKDQTTYKEAVGLLGLPSDSQLTAKGNWLHSWSFVRAEGIVNQTSITHNKSMTLVFGPNEKLLGIIQYKGFPLTEADRTRLMAVPPAPAQATPDASVAPAVSAPANYAVTKPKTPMGKHQASARSAALGQTCAQQPNPKLVSSAPGNETYTVACDDSSVLVLRCEFGNCRPMQ